MSLSPAPAQRRHYAWTVLLLCFFAILCAQGVRLSFRAFVRPWEEKFDVSRWTITLIGSLSFLVYGGARTRLRRPPSSPAPSGYVEPRTVGLAFGCLNAIHQLGSAIGAWVPGVAFDATGSYDEVMITAAVVLGIASVTCLALPRPARLAPAPAPALP
jgi:sugar phosphate permease